VVAGGFNFFSFWRLDYVIRNLNNKIIRASLYFHFRENGKRSRRILGKRVKKNEVERRKIPKLVYG